MSVLALVAAVLYTGFTVGAHVGVVPWSLFQLPRNTSVKIAVRKLLE